MNQAAAILLASLADTIDHKLSVYNRIADAHGWPEVHAMEFFRMKTNVQPGMYGENFDKIMSDLDHKTIPILKAWARVRDMVFPELEALEESSSTDSLGGRRIIDVITQIPKPHRDTTLFTSKRTRDQMQETDEYSPTPSPPPRPESTTVSASEESLVVNQETLLENIRDAVRETVCDSLPALLTEFIPEIAKSVVKKMKLLDEEAVRKEQNIKKKIEEMSQQLEEFMRHLD